jgi:hypothetical protein
MKTNECGGDGSHGVMCGRGEGAAQQRRTLRGVPELVEDGRVGESGAGDGLFPVGE